MALIYVTGIAGAGKSTVCSGLRRRGYATYGTDEDGLAAFYHNATGRSLGSQVPSEVRTEQWRKEHSWKVPREAVESLAHEAKDKLVFLCGVVANEDEFIGLFSKVIALTVNKELLIYRLKTRPNNNFGKLDHELRDVLEWHNTAVKDHELRGDILVDATRPLSDVVDEIIRLTTR